MNIGTKMFADYKLRKGEAKRWNRYFSKYEF